MSIIEELVEYVLDTRFESINQETITQAKYRIIDVIGCLIAGTHASGCLDVISLVKEWGGAKESTILVHGDKAPAHNVAMVNSIMARSFDFEPVGPSIDGVSIPAHISGTTVPTALAMAEYSQASGKELITSLILGDDITSRLAAASGFSFNLGWDNTGTVNIFGATTIAGRLLKLNKRQMSNAFGIAVNQMAGSLQNIYDGSHCFKLPMGLAAQAGIFSAKLASKGFTGIKDPLMSKHGYFDLYCQTPNPEILTKDLGKKFYADSTFKLYPACRFTHGAIECALQVTNIHCIRPEDIDKIIVNVTPIIPATFAGQPFEIGDVPQVNAIFNIRYVVANILLRKSIRLEHFTEESVLDPKVLDLVRKVELAATIPLEKRLATGLKITMKDGKEYSAYIDIPKGDIFQSPQAKEQIKQKFTANVAFSQVVPEENAEKTYSLIEKLEDMDNIIEIIREIS
jgi:2-methylcitrate dehydratase PrpD